MDIRRAIKAPVRRWREYRRLTPAAKRERQRDRTGLPARDPGVRQVVREGLAWLGRAQDRSRSGDGGVARHYSLNHGWGASYPETTGYIVPTMLEHGERLGDEGLTVRARRMLDWLVSIQFPEGGFQGGTVWQTPAVPVVFNTGQILIGLAAGATRWPQYREPMERAAQWLVSVQDDDGCWRRYGSPLAADGLKVYDAHCAWGLLEAARVSGDSTFADSARANVEWALTHQRDNGWFDHCCLSDADRPLTHTIGYALRGLLEAYRFREDPDLLVRVRLTADSLAAVLARDGYLAGRLDARWRPSVSWSCLTGTVQIAHCWLLLYRLTGDDRYREAGCAANAFVRRTVSIDGPLSVRGGVKGAFPVNGDYGRYQYLNWATKFCIDANTLETDLHSERGNGIHGYTGADSGAVRSGAGVGAPQPVSEQPLSGGAERPGR